ncbi:cytochrome d ubiquinol oxidase subunit II [Rhodoplanes elegans]|uniref:Cytochrome d ubiquinol oxidase subunit II n=1 Tax=Rhodoplanes elegans TaxID=29408 RepID=A0A327KUH5_9BRAD|nr:cytochrome d ubiquinol oxidase subunit II [Rhodoplanes elegans]MBK5962514.1 cytochrome d ubiquinol oxidase subunit II [Rhodoplanes elegans]RAI41095.1 cytochrome d ubiquinol oxidase subunit II [Rhodoplanes elegans]
MEPSSLVLFFVGVVAVSVLIYVILDGADLGVGILFGTTRDEHERDQMIAAIAPFWDGNETWLIVVGTVLFAAFPAVYAVFLSAFYLPVVLLLVGLIFRGVAFEFRSRSKRLRPLWDRGFWLGSTVVAFVQGAAVGAMIQGIPVSGGQYAGGAFAWLAPFPVLCGVGLAIGYALLGASWLVLKSEGGLRERAYRLIPWLAGAMVVVLAIATGATLVVAERVASHLAGRTWGLVFPLVGVLAVAGIVLGARRRRDGWPFAMTSLFFLMAFLTLAVLFWPYMIPYALTVADTAAPEPSLDFLFWGTIIILPVIFAYTIAVYWIFRGKLQRGYP